MDTQDPTQTDNYLLAIDLPSSPNNVTIASGIGFIADGSGGLVILNYLPFDNKGQPPTATVSAPAADINPAEPGTQVVAGSRVYFEATTTDDVQVSKVELLINGSVVATDFSYPWDFSAIVPQFSPDNPNFVVQVRATDTGGNITLSDPSDLVLVQDLTPPTLVSLDPADGSSQIEGSQILFGLRFSEPIVLNGALSDVIQFIDSSGGVHAPVSATFFNSDEQVKLAFADLAGSYQLVIHAAAITDRAGNLLDSSDITSGLTLTYRSTLSTTLPDADPNTPGLQEYEGTTIPFSVGVSPGVRVKSIELLVNGTVVSTSKLAAAQFSVIAPNITPDVSSLIVQARITDQDGFATLSPPIDVLLLQDTTPPTVISSVPADGGSRIEGTDTVTVHFSESLAKSVLTANPFSLLDSSGTVETITGLTLSNDDHDLKFNYKNLVADDYQLMIHAAAITDRAGNPMGTDDITQHFTLTPRSILSSTIPDGDPATPGTQILEGSQVPLHVTVDSSVAVQEIEILANGSVVATGSSAPADFTIAAPHISSEVQTLTVQARVTDSRGFITLSYPIVFDLVANAVPFGVVSSSPGDGGVGINLQSLTVTFTQDLDASRTDPSGITLVDLGPDHKVGGGDDTIVPLASVQTTGGQLVISAQQPLPRDKYQLSVDARAATDLSGDQLGSTYSIIFANYVVAPNTDVWIASTSGDWNTPSNWSSNAIPKTTDVVIIDPLDAPLTVTHSSGSHTIKSLQSTQAFVLSGGSLVVTTGTSALSNSFTARNGGQLTIQSAGTSFSASAATALDGAGLTLLDGGSITVPSGTALTNGSLTIDNTPADLSNLIDLTGTIVTLRNGGTADLHNVAKIDDASFIVSGGVTLALPGAVSYAGGTNNRTLSATGPASVLDLSAVTTFSGQTGSFSQLQIQAQGGGFVKLGAVANIQLGHATVLADGIGSVVDLSSLAQFTSTDAQLESSVQATEAPSLPRCSLNSISVDLLVASPMATRQIATFNHGQVTADGVPVDLSGLTSFNDDGLILRNGSTADLHNVTTIHNSSFDIGGGVSFALPAASTYSADSDGKLFLIARDAGSLLDLSQAAGFGVDTGSGQLKIQALDGGHVDLHTLSAIAAGHATVLAQGTDSTVDLASLTHFSSTAGQSSLETRDGGTILMGLLTQLDAVDLYVGGTMATSQITIYTNGNGTGGGAISEIEPNDSLNTAQDLDAASWSLAFNPDIGDMSSNTSTSVPHVSVQGSGDDTNDFYRFTVDQPEATVILDIDNGNDYSALFLFDAAGNPIATGYGSPDSFGAGGSAGGVDAFLQTSVPAGVYYVAVSSASSYAGSGGSIFGPGLFYGDSYTLQISIQGHEFSTGGITADSKAIDLGGLTSFAGDSLTLINGGTADLHNVTDITSASFDVHDGVRLSLPSATSYTASTDTQSWCSVSRVRAAYSTFPL